MTRPTTNPNSGLGIAIVIAALVIGGPASQLYAQEPTIDQFVETQQSLIRRLDFKTVIEKCDRRLDDAKEQSERPLILAIRSVAHEWLFENDKASKDIENALQGNPSDSRVWAFCSLSTAALSQFEASLKYGKRAVELNPNLALNHRCLGYAYHVNGDFAKAIASAEKAIQLAPNSPENHRMKSIVHFSLEQKKAFFASVNRALQLDPNYASAFVDRGYERILDGDRDTGLQDLAKAEKLAPNLGLVQSTRGLAQIARSARYVDPDPKIIEQAMTDLDFALKQFPRRSSYLRNKSYALAATKRFDEAIKVGKQAIECAPTEAASYLSLAQVYSLNDNPDKAIVFLKKAAEVQPKLYQPYFFMALVESRRNNTEAAIAAYSESLKRHPRHELSLYLRATYFAGSEQYQKAIEDFTKLIGVNPTVGYYYWDRGIAYEKLGNAKMAKADKEMAELVDRQSNQNQ